MMVKVEDAARSLLATLDAPCGAVNTLALRDQRRTYIRVLVDPGYHSRLQHVPKTFAGYSVEVEERLPTIAQSVYVR